MMLTPCGPYTFAVCIPGHVSRILSIRYLLDSIRHQTFRHLGTRHLRVEVIVAWDGEEPENDRDWLPLDMYPTLSSESAPDWFNGVTSLPSPRTPGNEKEAHRNHARNVAARGAMTPHYPADTEEIPDGIFFCDADMVLEESFIEHAILALQEYACLTPVMFARDKEGMPTPVFEGFAGEYVSDSHYPKVKNVGPICEGMPIMRRAVWEAVGPFDERFIGWGGNKVEWVSRLRAKGFPYYLLNSTSLLHAWHPVLPRDVEIVERNTALIRMIEAVEHPELPQVTRDEDGEMVGRILEEGEAYDVGAGVRGGGAASVGFVLPCGHSEDDVEPKTGGVGTTRYCGKCALGE